MIRPKLTKAPTVSLCLAGLAALAALPAAAAGPEPFSGTPVVSQPPASSLADWNGSYVGLSFGAVRSDGEAERADFSGAIIERDVENDLFPADIDEGEVAAAGGAAVGYNVQRGSYVGGVELDLQAMDHDVGFDFSRIDPSTDPVFGGVETNTSYATEIDAMMTLRVRAGFALERTLFYGTAGLASAEVRNEFALALPDLGYTSPDWNEDGTRNGYVLGLGVERKMSDRVSLKAEVLRYDLDDVIVEGEDPATFPGQTIDYEFQNNGTLARIGLNFSF